MKITIVNLETGRRIPRVDNLGRIAKALGGKISDFISKPYRTPDRRGGGINIGAVYRIRLLSEMDIGLALHDLRDRVADTEIGREGEECIVRLVS